jgi:hypothetical protein
MVTRLQHSSSPQKSPIAGVAPGIPVAGAHRAQSSGNNFGDVSQNSQHTHQLSMGSLPLPRQASGASTASLRTGLSATPRQHHHQQQQQPQQGYFMVMDEQLDASRYASPQQAFEAVAALCRQQRDAFEAAQASWRLEKQVRRSVCGHDKPLRNLFLEDDKSLIIAFHTATPLWRN